MVTEAERQLLTPQERIVLDAAAKGGTIANAARALGLHHSTTHRCVTNAEKKLGRVLIPRAGKDIGDPVGESSAMSDGRCGRCGQRMRDALDHVKACAFARAPESVGRAEDYMRFGADGEAGFRL